MKCLHEAGRVGAKSVKTFISNTVKNLEYKLVLIFFTLSLASAYFHVLFRGVTALVIIVK